MSFFYFFLSFIILVYYLFWLNLCIYWEVRVKVDFFHQGIQRCGNHFMMYVSHITMLYTLNLYSVICQLYINKTRRKKRKVKCNRKQQIYLPHQFLMFFFFFFLLFRAALVPYGASQARDWIRATAAALCHSHSNIRSKQHL